MMIQSVSRDADLSVFSSSFSRKGFVAGLLPDRDRTPVRRYPAALPPAPVLFYPVLKDGRRVPLLLFPVGLCRISG